MSKHLDLLRRIETLLDIPTGELIMSAKAKELEVLLSPLLEEHYTSKLIGNNTVNSDSPVFNLRLYEDERAIWKITTEDTEIQDIIFSNDLIEFIVSHKVNPEVQYDRVFKNLEFTIHLIFCRWEFGRISGKYTFTRAKKPSLRVVQTIPMEQLTSDAQYNIFQRIIESDPKARQAILEYFFQIYHPLNLADAV